MNSELNEPQQRLLVSCAADWVGLWVVTGEARIWFDPTSEVDLREKTASLLQPLLSLHLIEAGDLNLDAGAFHRWDEQGDAALQRVLREWKHLGREPSIGEIAWFQATAKGEEEAARLAPSK